MNYSADTALAIDLSSLATSSTFLAGRESDQQDNTSNKYDDVIVHCHGILGHASTAPTIGQIIAIYLWGSDVSLATTPIDTLDGADSAETLSHAGILRAMSLVRNPGVTAATAALKYYPKPFNVAEYFGGNMPKFWGLYVTHNHTGALAAAQSGLFSYYGITH